MIILKIQVVVVFFSVSPFFVIFQITLLLYLEDVQFLYNCFNFGSFDFLKHSLYYCQLQ